MKLCTTCKIEKPKSEMVSSNGKATSMCRACSRIKASKVYHEKTRVAIDGLQDRVENTRIENIERDKAIESGATHYKTTKKCKHGHLGVRLVSTRQCCKCLQIRKHSQVERGPAIEKKKKELKRKIARNMGQTYYFTGLPCGKGHIVNRLVSNGQCTQCLAERPKRKSACVNSKEAIAKKNSSRKTRLGRYKSRKYYKDVLSKNENHKLKMFMRACLRRTSTSRNEEKTREILGYTSIDLRSRIQFNFKPGMTWDNYGEWHIDHVKPISRFLDQGIVNPKIINALCNLKPLWAADNLRKNNSF